MNCKKSISEATKLAISLSTGIPLNNNLIPLVFHNLNEKGRDILEKTSNGTDMDDFREMKKSFGKDIFIENMPFDANQFQETLRLTNNSRLSEDEYTFINSIATNMIMNITPEQLSDMNNVSVLCDYLFSRNTNFSRYYNFFKEKHAELSQPVRNAIRENFEAAENVDSAEDELFLSSILYGAKDKRTQKEMSRNGGRILFDKRSFDNAKRLGIINEMNPSQLTGIFNNQVSAEDTNSAILDEILDLDNISQAINNDEQRKEMIKPYGGHYFFTIKKAYEVLSLSNNKNCRILSDELMASYFDDTNNFIETIDPATSHKLTGDYAEDALRITKMDNCRSSLIYLSNRKLSGTHRQALLSAIKKWNNLFSDSRSISYKN